MIGQSPTNDPQMTQEELQAQIDLISDYYDLPKEDRWLGDSNPYQIGGRDTDFEQVGYSLIEIIRNRYPINQVPEHILDRLNILVQTLEEATKEYEDFILFMSREVAYEEGRNR